MKQIDFNIEGKEVKGFYFSSNVSVKDDKVFLDDYEFASKTLAYMVSDLKMVYSFFMYLPNDNENYYEILHKAELELVKMLGFRKDSFSIFKPGLIIDWKNGQINKFIDYLNSKKPDVVIKADKESHKVTPEHSFFGLLFQSTLTSISCMFCDLLTCEYRRSDLDKKLIDKIYRLENSKESKL